MAARNLLVTTRDTPSISTHQKLMFVDMFLCICNTKYENNVEKITI